MREERKAKKKRDLRKFSFLRCGIEMQTVFSINKKILRALRRGACKLRRINVILGKREFSVRGGRAINTTFIYLEKCRNYVT